MKAFIFLILAVCMFYGCGSTKSGSLYMDSSFTSEDFFSSSITVYPPLVVSIGKNPGYKEEAVSEITQMLKSGIDRISRTAVNIGSDEVPGYCKGDLSGSKEAKKFFKKSKSKYLILVQQVVVGKELKMESNRMGGISRQDAETVVMFFDIWNSEKGVSVFSVRIESKVNDTWLTNGLKNSFEKCIDKFISSIKES